MATVVLLGTLDTKGKEYDYLRARVREQGVDVVLVDAGVFEPLAEADVSQDEVAAAAGVQLAALREAADRGAAVDAMGRGAAEIVRRLHEEGRLGGILTVGGSGNSSIGAQAMRGLPVGVPKLIVSTLASGDTRPYVGATDVSMTYSVVDISGLNRISERILSNAAGAIAGMAKVSVAEAPGEGRPLGRAPLIGASMFGVTTPSVTRARERLEELGYEVLVFHATGTGGQSMEALARGGYLAGVLDITTTELADELVGGVLSAGPDRLEAAGELGCRRSSHSARSTWSTSGRSRLCPRSSRGATSMCTTRRSPSCARRPRSARSSAARSAASSRLRRGQRRSSFR